MLKYKSLMSPENHRIPSESRLVAIYYVNEYDEQILLGFFTVPLEMDVAQEIETFREATRCNGSLTLRSWLAERGATSETDMDKALRDKAQEGEAIVRPKLEDDEQGGISKLVKPGSLPVIVDSSQTEAELIQINPW